MKSLKDYIILELKDETYLNLAKKRKKQGKDISNILSFTSNKLIKEFLNDLTQYNCSKYIKNIDGKDRVCDIYFDDMLHWSRTSDKNLIKNMQDDIISLGKKYNRIIHGVRFLNYYVDEDPHIYIYILDRKNYIKDIKENKILYHLTTGDNTIDKILKEGLVPQNAVNYSKYYTYNCVFAFKDLKHLNKYRNEYYTNKEDKKNYYVIEFIAGDNIYFNDWMLNASFIHSLDSIKRTENNIKKEQSSIYTLEKIDVSQIIKITKYNGKESKIIYEK